MMRLQAENGGKNLFHILKKSIMTPVIEPVCDLVWKQTYREMNKMEEYKRMMMTEVQVYVVPQEFFNNIQAMIYKEVR